jgi:hypothetical protein
LEAGSKDVTLIEPEQSKTGPMVIQFTENCEPIGAIKFSFFPHSNMFKIATVVNARCEKIATYRNETNVEDKNVLQNWDSLASDDGYGLWR